MGGEATPHQLNEHRLAPFMGTITAEVANLEYVLMQQIPVRYPAMPMSSGEISFERSIRQAVFAASSDTIDPSIIELVPDDARDSHGEPAESIKADPAGFVLEAIDATSRRGVKPTATRAKPLGKASVGKVLDAMPAMLEASAHSMGKSEGLPTALRNTLVLLERIVVTRNKRAQSIDLETTTIYLCAVRAAATLDMLNNTNGHENHSRQRPKDDSTYLAPTYLDILKPLIRLKAQQRTLPTCKGLDRDIAFKLTS